MAGDIGDDMSNGSWPQETKVWRTSDGQNFDNKEIADRHQCVINSRGEQERKRNGWIKLLQQLVPIETRHVSQINIISDKLAMMEHDDVRDLMRNTPHI
jgi:hypothetical protein